MTHLRKKVSDYYSKITTDDEGEMQTNICSCASDAMPDYLKEVRKELPDEIITRFYGCGSPKPKAIEGNIGSISADDGEGSEVCCC